MRRPSRHLPKKDDLRLRDLNKDIYRGFAKYYDFLYKPPRIDYSQEVGFIIDSIPERRRKSPLRVLDLGCGTGSHLLEFQKLGHHVTGIDVSEEMLEVARLKFQEASAPGAFTKADFTSWKSKQVYDLVVALFDSIGYALTDDEVDAAFAIASRHTRDNGYFFFEFWQPGRFNIQSNHWDEADAKHKRVLRLTSWQEYRIEEVPLIELKFEILVFEIATGHQVESYVEVHHLRSWEPHELEGVVRKHDLEIVHYFDGGRFDQPKWVRKLPGPDTLRTLAMARKE